MQAVTARCVTARDMTVRCIADMRLPASLDLEVLGTRMSAFQSPQGDMQRPFCKPGIHRGQLAFDASLKAPHKLQERQRGCCALDEDLRPVHQRRADLGSCEPLHAWSGYTRRRRSRSGVLALSLVDDYAPPDTSDDGTGQHRLCAGAECN